MTGPQGSALNHRSVTYPVKTPFTNYSTQSLRIDNSPPPPPDVKAASSCQVATERWENRYTPESSAINACLLYKFTFLTLSDGKVHWSCGQTLLFFGVCFHSFSSNRHFMKSKKRIYIAMQSVMEAYPKHRVYVEMCITMDWRLGNMTNETNIFQSR